MAKLKMLSFGADESALPERVRSAISAQQDRSEILIGWSQAVLRTGGQDEVLSSGHDQATACRALLAGLLRRRLSSDPPPDHGALAVSWIHAAYRSLRDKAWREA